MRAIKEYKQTVKNGNYQSLERFKLMIFMLLFWFQDNV
ncbi:hypothetical protein PPEP_a4157 [Pseudoalteromonas peptidolytica F12-50-A1]|uniref:Uncharacterized protein n=1 Tax=Pseudoalteromonas peptidolytica F12-50-A1 TaxID=1315280 RepID=A0A8I0MST6_9GAMM|nr:hypothetical protein [Pseudoalteromonas peptidolytica F12-50-A1]